MSRTKKEVAWHTFWLSVLGWEAIALASGGRVPWLSDVARSLPRPVRVAIPVVIAGALVDHFDRRKIF